jgi:hypothetical protein
MVRMADVPDDERLKYGQFVELLNTMRSKGLVTAEHRRELAKRWSAEQENRDLILEEIERIMEEHSRQLIKDY